jgi:hypothetical protein
VEVPVVEVKIFVATGCAASLGFLAWCLFTRSTDKVKPAYVFTGGYKTTQSSGGMGTAELEFFDDTIKLWGCGLHRPMLNWQARYADLVEAKATSSFRWGPGVVLVTTDRSWVAFWSSQGPAILNLLAQRGVAINWTEARLRPRIWPWGTDIGPPTEDPGMPARFR